MGEIGFWVIKAIREGKNYLDYLWDEGAPREVSLNQRREASPTVEGCCVADSQVGARRKGLLLGGWSYES